MCTPFVLRATRNEHHWTCTVPWHVFLLCVETLQMTTTTTQAVKHRRLAGPTSLQKKKKSNEWCVPPTDVIAVTRKSRKNSQAALLGLMRCQHSKLPPAGIVAMFVPRQTSLDGARRHQHVCPRAGQAQRAEILPFLDVGGRFLSQRGYVVQHCQL